MHTQPLPPNREVLGSDQALRVGDILEVRSGENSVPSILKVHTEPYFIAAGMAQRDYTAPERVVDVIDYTSGATQRTVSTYRTLGLLSTAAHDSTDIAPLLPRYCLRVVQPRALPPAPQKEPEAAADSQKTQPISTRELFAQKPSPSDQLAHDNLTELDKTIGELYPKDLEASDIRPGMRFTLRLRSGSSESTMKGMFVSGLEEPSEDDTEPVKRLGTRGRAILDDGQTAHIASWRLGLAALPPTAEAIDCACTADGVDKHFRDEFMRSMLSDRE